MKKPRIPEDAVVAVLAAHFGEVAGFTSVAEGMESQGVCPNCGGGFVPRPIRPQRDWRPETGLMFDKPGTRRRHAKYSREEIAAFSAGISGIPPAGR